MKSWSLAVLGLVVAASVVGCQRSSSKRTGHDAGPTVADRSVPGRPQRTNTLNRPQYKPPLPVAQPPADAEQLTNLPQAPRAVIHIKRLAPGSGGQPGRNDTVSINFTGWRLDGDTFLSTRTRKRPVQQSLAVVAPGFAAAVATMHQGERAMVWIPPELGYMGPPTDTPETTVYEIELVGFEPAPATPADVAAPPATATRTPSGLAYEVVTPGDGKVKPRFQDQITYDYTAWDATGRMFDSSEVRKRNKMTFVFKEWPAIEEALRTMVVGERKRVWIPPDLVVAGPGIPAGPVCFELTLLSVKPMRAAPPVPADVAAPPDDAERTAKGVAYRRLKVGKGKVRPTPTDTVRAHYSGWTTDGRLFESSVVRGEPAQLPLGRLMPGLADGLQHMVVGDRTRFWVPVEQAYNHEPGRPEGPLVFDIELFDIVRAPAPAAPAAPIQ